MTFKDWGYTHNTKLDAVLAKLEGKTAEEISDYFEFDNMVENEPDYCVLYKSGTKCHDMDNLNCLLCACPFFHHAESEEKPLAVNGSIDVMSKCAIHSKDATTHTYTNKEKSASDYTYRRVQQCDCSGCTIPHKKRFVVAHVEDQIMGKPIADSISLLEMIRGWQLSDILGKWKLI